MNQDIAERLVEAIRWWKTTEFLFEIETRAKSLAEGLPINPLVKTRITNWRRFEQIVMDQTISTLNLEDWSRPRFKEELADAVARSAVALQYFPIEFFQWSRCSRRVYKLDVELQEIFAQANFSKFRWKDALWPFTSFVVQLARPIEIEDQEGLWSKYDTILVGRITAGTQHHRSIRLFRAPLVPQAGSITDREKKKIEKVLESGNYLLAAKLLIKAIKEVWRYGKSCPQGSRLLYWPEQDPTKRIRIETKDLRRQSVVSFDESTIDWEDDISSTMLKTVVGLCIHLGSVSSPPVEWEPYEPRTPGTRGITGIITNPDHICSVIMHGKIDPETYGLGERQNNVSGFFKKPHPRRAHFRRPKGSPPNAPKTVEVPETIVRRDLIPMYGLMAGTTTEVLPHHFDDE